MIYDINDPFVELLYINRYLEIHQIKHARYFPK